MHCHCSEFLKLNNVKILMNIELDCNTPTIVIFFFFEFGLISLKWEIPLKGGCISELPIPDSILGFGVSDFPPSRVPVLSIPRFPMSSFSGLSPLWIGSLVHVTSSYMTAVICSRRSFGVCDVTMFMSTELAILRSPMRSVTR
jgi:hypothetical protein